MKKTRLIFAAMVLLSAFVISTNANVIYKVHEAVETDITIKYKWDEGLEDELEFKSPFVVIDGVTYVPLRELAEMGNIEVEWDGETREVTLHDNSYRFLDYDQIFQKLFGFALPAGVTYKNGFHSFDGGDHTFYAKYAVDSVAMEYFRDQLASDFYKHTDSDEDLTVSFSGRVNLKWWTLENKADALELYSDDVKGVNKLTVRKYVAFTVEDGQNYVYIQYA